MYGVTQADMEWIWLNLKQGILIFGSATAIVGAILWALIALKRRMGPSGPPEIEQEPPYERGSTPTLRSIPSAPSIKSADDPSVDIASQTTQVISRERLISSFRHIGDLRRFLKFEEDVAHMLASQTRDLAEEWRLRVRDADITDEERAVGLEAEALLLEAEEAFSEAEPLGWQRVARLFYEAKQRFYDVLLPQTDGERASERTAANT